MQSTSGSPEAVSIVLTTGGEAGQDANTRHNVGYFRALAVSGGFLSIPGGRLTVLMRRRVRSGGNGDGLPLLGPNAGVQHISAGAGPGGRQVFVSWIPQEELADHGTRDGAIGNVRGGFPTNPELQSGIL